MQTLYDGVESEQEFYNRFQLINQLMWETTPPEIKEILRSAK